MLKFIRIVFVVLVYSTTYGQVGINTSNPEALTDIGVSNVTSPSVIDGMLIPRIDNFPAINPTNNQNALMVFLNNNIYDVNIDGLDKNYTKGFYYWDQINGDWVRVKTGHNYGPEITDWSVVGNIVKDDDYLGTYNDFPFELKVNNNHQFSITKQGQIIPRNPQLSARFGDTKVPSGQNSISMGINNNADGANSVSIGGQNVRVTSISVDGVAIGQTAAVTEVNGVAYGRQVIVKRETVGIGNQIEAGDRNVLVGNHNYNQFSRDFNVNATGFGYDLGVFNGAILLGSGATANSIKYHSTAIGYNTNSYELRSVTLGAGLSGGAYNQSNLMVLSNVNDFDLNGATLSNPSDGRFKYNVQDNIPGLAFIMDLKPVTYNFDYKKYDKFRGKKDLSIRPEGVVESGFIAQEVEASADKMNYDFDGIIIPKDAENQNYRVAYSKFVVALVKTKQQQQSEIELLKEGLVELKSMLHVVESVN